jgi:cell division protein FtsQ
MKKKLVRVIVWSVSMLVVVVLFGFVNMQRRSAMCVESKVNILGDSSLQFIVDDDVYALLAQKGIRIDTVLAADVNLLSIENEIKHHPAVQNADVYYNPSGVLCMDILQRTPILRIVDAFGESYYIDDQGAYMPLISRYAARVPVATGAITDPYYKLNMTVNELIANDSLAKHSSTDDLFHFAMAARRDTFIWAQLEQVVVLPNGDLEMVPSMGPGSVLIGDVTHLEEKFRNLQLFYQQGLPLAGWDTYSALNLKYNNQIICTKNIH